METQGNNDIEFIARLYRDVIKVEKAKTHLIEALKVYIEVANMEEDLLMLTIDTLCHPLKNLLDMSLKTEEEILDEVKAYYVNIKGE